MQQDKPRIISDIQPRQVRPTSSMSIKTKPQVQSLQNSSAPVQKRESSQQKAVIPEITEYKFPQQKVKRRDNPLTIQEHLQELRMRLLWSVTALIIGGVLGYVYHDFIIAVLVKPLGQQLFYTSPAGGFDFLIKTCIFFGFLLAIPILVYNLLRFVVPAMPERVTYGTGKVLVISTILAFLGAAFAYFVSLPAALHFLNNFSTGPVQSLISANEYFNFVMIYVAGFAALFQMPLVLYFVNKITPLTPKLLMQKQRFVILASFIVAAILTPTPDPINQTLMALPIIFLYQSSIGVVWHSNRGRKPAPTLQSSDEYYFGSRSLVNRAS